MRYKDKKFIEKYMEPISLEVFNVKHLTVIMEEALTNGNLTGSDVATLAFILKRTAEDLSEKVREFKSRLGM